MHLFVRRLLPAMYAYRFEALLQPGYFMRDSSDPGVAW